MSQLDALRLFVQQRLSAASEDIFRRFARTIREYEAEVLRLRQEVERQDRPLGDRQEDRQEHRREDRPAGQWTKTLRSTQKMSAHCVT